MIWPFRHRARIEAAEKAAREAQSRRRDVEAQWPEVRRLSAWAQQTRGENHFAERIRAVFEGAP